MFSHSFIQVLLDTKLSHPRSKNLDDFIVYFFSARNLGDEGENILQKAKNFFPGFTNATLPEFTEQDRNNFAKEFIVKGLRERIAAFICEVKKINHFTRLADFEKNRLALEALFKNDVTNFLLKLGYQPPAISYLIHTEAFADHRFNLVDLIKLRRFTQYLDAKNLGNKLTEEFNVCLEFNRECLTLLGAKNGIKDKKYLEDFVDKNYGILSSEKNILIFMQNYLSASKMLNFCSLASDRVAIQNIFSLSDQDFYDFASAMLKNGEIVKLYDANSTKEYESQTKAMKALAEKLDPYAKSIFYKQLAYGKLTNVFSISQSAEQEKQRSFLTKASENKLPKITNPENSADYLKPTTIARQFSIYYQTQSKKNSIERGDTLKTEAAQDYLHALKSNIESKSWYVSNFGGGVTVEGLNRGEPVPHLVAKIYNTVKLALDDRHYWPTVESELKKLANDALAKSKSWNFFWLRDPDTIKFYKNFHTEVNGFLDNLHAVDAKLTKRP